MLIVLEKIEDMGRLDVLGVPCSARKRPLFILRDGVGIFKLPKVLRENSYSHQGHGLDETLAFRNAG